MHPTPPCSRPACTTRLAAGPSSGASSPGLWSVSTTRDAYDSDLVFSQHATLLCPTRLRVQMLDQTRRQFSLHLRVLMSDQTRWRLQTRRLLQRGLLHHHRPRHRFTAAPPVGRARTRLHNNIQRPKIPTDGTVRYNPAGPPQFQCRCDCSVYVPAGAR